MANVMKKKVNIRDRNFSHDISSCADTPTKHIEWCRDNVEVSKSCFLTDLCLTDIHKAVNVKRKVAWILEPRSIHPHTYNWIEQNNRLFDFVLTFDKSLLDKGENYIYYPHGRCWIKNYQHTPKTKLCSIFASEKRMTVGHRLRHTVIDAHRDQLDCFGNYTGNRIDDKIDGLAPYYYSIAIENDIISGYWTEKLLDCFATKTIPIYYGDKESVSKYFNPEGILFFTNLQELDDILSNIDRKSYNKREVAVDENFNLVEDYRVPEDWIFENYPFLFE